LQRGVEVLHLIPTPFPGVWHTMNDDGEHLDMPTVEDWARMIIAFAGEWMDLEGYFPKANKEKRASSSKTEL
jgi:glutaminyl-peptide cyclotransferase